MTDRRQHIMPSSSLGCRLASAILERTFVYPLSEEACHEAVAMHARLCQRSPSNFVPVMTTLYALGAPPDHKLAGSASNSQGLPIGILRPTKVLPPVGGNQVPPASAEETRGGPPAPAAVPMSPEGLKRFSSLGHMSFSVAVTLDVMRTVNPLRFFLKQFHIRNDTGPDGKVTVSYDAPNHDWESMKGSARQLRRGAAALSRFLRLQEYLFGASVINALYAMVALAEEQGISRKVPHMFEASHGQAGSQEALRARLEGFFHTVERWFPPPSAKVSTTVEVQTPPAYLVEWGRTLVDAALRKQCGALTGSKSAIIDVAAERHLDKPLPTFTQNVNAQHAWWWPCCLEPAKTASPAADTSRYTNRDPWLPSVEEVAEIAVIARSLQGVATLLTQAEVVVKEFWQRIVALSEASGAGEWHAALRSGGLGPWAHFLKDGLLSYEAAGTAHVLRYDTVHNTEPAPTANFILSTRGRTRPYISQFPFTLKKADEYLDLTPELLSSNTPSYPDHKNLDIEPQPLWRSLLLATSTTLISEAMSKYNAARSTWQAAQIMHPHLTIVPLFEQAQRSWFHSLLSAMLEVLSLPAASLARAQEVVLDQVIAFERRFPPPVGVSDELHLEHTDGRDYRQAYTGSASDPSAPSRQGNGDVFESVPLGLNRQAPPRPVDKLPVPSGEARTIRPVPANKALVQTGVSTTPISVTSSSRMSLPAMSRSTVPPPDLSPIMPAPRVAIRASAPVQSGTGAQSIFEATSPSEVDEVSIMRTLQELGSVSSRASSALLSATTGVPSRTAQVAPRPAPSQPIGVVRSSIAGQKRPRSPVQAMPTRVADPRIVPEVFDEDLFDLHGITQPTQLA